MANNLNKKKTKNNSNDNDDSTGFDGSSQTQLRNILHVLTGKRQVIIQQTADRSASFEKLVEYFSHVLQALEGIELSADKILKKGVIVEDNKDNNSSSSSLLCDEEIKNALRIKLTNRVETYMKEIRKIIERLESYEEIISNGMKEASEKLAFIDQQQILSALLHLQIENVSGEDKNDSTNSDITQENKTKDKKKSKKDDDDDDQDTQTEEQKEEYASMIKNITNEIEKLAVIEKEFKSSLRTAKMIKQEFQPFRNNDMNIPYWKKIINLGY